MTVDRRDFLLEQFKQAHEHHRHYDRVGWIMISILLPVSLGVLAYGATYAAGREPALRMLGPLAFISVVTLVAMRVMVGRMGYWQDHRSKPFIERIEDEFCGYRFFALPAPITCQGTKCTVVKHPKLLWHYLVRHGFTVRIALNLLVVLYAGAWIALVCIVQWWPLGQQPGVN